MKKFLLFVLLVAGLGVAGCEKSSSVKSAKYKGVVVYNVCCNVVIQTVGSESLGQDGWEDGNNSAHPTYNHVFKVANSCEFGNHSEGDTVSFTIVAPQAQKCACCMIYVASPEKSYSIHVE